MSNDDVLAMQRRAASLVGAVRLLQSPDSSLGQQARGVLPRSTGLSAAMVEWALGSACEPWQQSTLAELAQRATRWAGPNAHSIAVSQAVVWLAGNLFSAALPALYLPLLFGVPIIARPSSREPEFPQLLKQALDQVDAALGAMLEVVAVDRHDAAATGALLQRAEVVCAYGDDTTMADLRQRLPNGVRLVEHGHGVAAAWVPRRALQSLPVARHAAHQLGLDIAAYDQRGCMSPHWVWVQSDGVISAAEFADLLADEAMPHWQQRLPRGRVLDAEAAAQTHWRNLVMALGRLRVDSDHAVADLGIHAPLPGPGGRHVAVHSCADAEALMQQLQPFGTHLKCIGVGGDDADLHQLAVHLRAPLAPRLAPLGSMQTPPLDALSDGEPVWRGLLRWAAIEGDGGDGDLNE